MPTLYSVTENIMHVHKPKPVNSFREFLSEIGVIVVGIVIAVLLEQAVEAVNRSREVSEAREALHAEIYENAERLKLTIEQNTCLEQQLDAYAAWARGGAKPPPYRAFAPALKVEVWDAIKASAVAHMPLKERIHLSSFYGLMNNQLKEGEARGLANEAIVSFGELTALNDDQRVLLLKAVAQAKRIAHTDSGTASRVIDYAGEYDKPKEPVVLPKILRPGVDWVCGRTAVDPYQSHH